MAERDREALDRINADETYQVDPITLRRFATSAAGYDLALVWSEALGMWEIIRRLSGRFLGRGATIKEAYDNAHRVLEDYDERYRRHSDD